MLAEISDSSLSTREGLCFNQHPSSLALTDPGDMNPLRLSGSERAWRFHVCAELEKERQTVQNGWEGLLKSTMEWTKRGITRSSNKGTELTLISEIRKLQKLQQKYSLGITESDFL